MIGRIQPCPYGGPKKRLTIRGGLSIVGGVSKATGNLSMKKKEVYIEGKHVSTNCSYNSQHLKSLSRS
jgi:hypothetical protein